MLCNCSGDSRSTMTKQSAVQYIIVGLFTIGSFAAPPTFQNCSLSARHPCGYCRCLDDVRLEEQYYCDCRYLEPERDCLTHLQKGRRDNGIYNIETKGLGVIPVFCDQTSEDGGWTVIQRRLDGSIDFYRNWTDYKHGFGESQHEFWIGNEKIHTMIKEHLFPFGTALHIALEDWEGNKRFAEYETVRVEDEKKHYAMVVGHYDGDAGDSGWGMSYHSGMPFTTYDRNNKRGNPYNCARERKGGWWYNQCATVNLNGRYFYHNKKVVPTVGIVWAPFNGQYSSLKKVEMKIRRNF